jgi:hypothetical protein
VVVSAVALLAIGISIGLLAERWRKGDQRLPDGQLRTAAKVPHLVPDQMPQPLLPGLGAPRAVPDGRSAPHAQIAPAPDPQSAPPDLGQVVPDPGSTLTDPFSARPGGGKSGGDAGAFRAFTSNLTQSLCRKLSECGVVDSATQNVCQAFAQEFDPEEAAAKVARGECSFNQKAADACLRAVSDLRCDANSTGDMMDWLMASHRVGECVEAYTCQ